MTVLGLRERQRAGPRGAGQCIGINTLADAAEQALRRGTDKAVLAVAVGIGEAGRLLHKQLPKDRSSREWRIGLDFLTTGKNGFV